MTIFAFIMAFLFCFLAGSHTSLILERRRTGNNIPSREYIFVVIDAIIGLYWLTVLVGSTKCQPF